MTLDTNASTLLFGNAPQTVRDTNNYGKEIKGKTLGL
jgi:hypothetical protein